MNDVFQQTFSFNNVKKAEELTEAEKDSIKNNDIRRAAVAWVLKDSPSGIGIFVPTRLSRFQADVAAFWSKPVRKSGRKILYPVKTTIIETKFTRDQCWPDCARKDSLLPLLREKKQLKKAIEETIRKNEPELNVNDNLFPDIETWNYQLTKNKDYHQCCRDIEEIETALYNGSHFEKIRKSLLADFLYLAVPEGLVSEHEIADGWGLLYVGKDMSVKIVKNAYDWECPIENKLHLVQNISMANLKNLLFTAGINVDKNGKTRFVRLPKRRRS